MSATLTELARHWIKHSPHPVARRTFQMARSLRTLELPLPGHVARTLYSAHTSVAGLLGEFSRALWWSPIFRGRTQRCGSGLYLYGGMPLVSGPLELTIGNDCRISGHSTFSARTASARPPRLEIGNNVDVGWQTTIAVGTCVRIGDNARIAGRAFLAGYPGHPLNAEDRAAGLPDTNDQVGDIILEDDVWLGTGVSVIAGVTIGRGTVVAAGSVVTRSLPPGVVAAGVPARVVRSIEQEAL